MTNSSTAMPEGGKTEPAYGDRVVPEEPSSWRDEHRSSGDDRSARQRSRQRGCIDHRATVAPEGGCISEAGGDDSEGVERKLVIQSLATAAAGARGLVRAKAVPAFARSRPGVTSQPRPEREEGSGRFPAVPNVRAKRETTVCRLAREADDKQNSLAGQAARRWLSA